MTDYNKMLDDVLKMIIIKYSEIESGTFHVLPDNFKEKFLFIVKVPVDLFINEKKVLETKIMDDLNNFDNSIIDKINIVFIQF